MKRNITNYLAKFLFITILWASPLVPNQAQAQNATQSSWGVDVSDVSVVSGSASEKFENLFKNLQKFSGVLLIIGCIMAGLMFILGKTSLSIMVFGGAIVVFGGAYVVGLIAGSFTEGNG